MLELFEQAKPVSCGNTWGTLSGDDQKRLCLECNRHVHNLATLSKAEFEQIKKENSGRICVVYRPFAMPWLVKYAAVLLPMLLISQLALAAKPKEEKPRGCETYMYTPMMFPPSQVCLNEKGKKVKYEDWRKGETKRGWKWPGLKSSGRKPKI